MTALAKIRDLLTPGQRRLFLGLCGLMVAMAIFDLAGIAMIVPFLAIIADPGMIEERAGLAAVYEALGMQSTQGFLQLLGGVLFLLVIAGIAARAVTFYAVTRFQRTTIQALAITLLRGHLARPYEHFLTRNSAEIGKTILAEAAYVVNQAVAPAIRLLANGLVALGLVGVLLWLEPQGALIAASVIGGAFFLIYQILQNRLLKVGEARLAAAEERFRITQEAMAGIKEVKLFGLEKAYADRFTDPSKRLARHQASIQLIGDMPHFALEALCFGGMLVFVLWLLASRQGDLAAVLPVIGAFAFAGLKLMPITKQMFRDLAMLRAGAPSLDSVAKELSALPEERGEDRQAPMGLSREIRFENVGYHYPGAKEEVVSGLDLTVPANTTTGIVGSSGAGKTTTIDLLLTLLPPTSGRILIDGVPVTKENCAAWRRSVGYVPQNIFLTDDTIAANIAFGQDGREVGEAEIRRAAELANLTSFLDSLPARLETPVGEAGVRLSGGQRQRIGIARALVHDPDVIVFDEATSALDSLTERAVMRAIRRLQGRKTVIIVTHRLSTVRNCDNIVLLSGGRVAGQGTYEDLRDRSREFREMTDA